MKRQELIDSGDGSTVADAYLALLADRGVDYLFGNAGTDFPPIIEGLAKGAVEGRPLPTALAVPHENLCVAMAHGYAMLTGRPQAVMVHVNVGTANAICGVLNASRENIPMLVTAGRTPVTEAGRAGSRSRYIHWAQEMYDQSGMLREAVKWDYELRDPSQVETVVDRALNIASSEPRGPVYLALPREVLAAPAVTRGAGESIRRHAARPAAPEPAALVEAAEILVGAENPLIITASVGRAPAAARALASLAGQFAIPVVSFGPRYVCLPSAHPMHVGYQPGARLEEADAVLVLEADVPWIPDLEGPPPDCPVIHLAVDPLFSRYPIRGFPCDIAITADPVLALPPLAEAMAERTGGAEARIEARRERVAAARRAAAGARADALAKLADDAPIHPGWLSHCVGRIRDGDTIVVNEMGVDPQMLTLGEPGTYFANSPAGGLGWGLGAALGVKLAAPDRFVIATVGDGAYQFGNPTPAHYVSHANGLPILFIVTNNGGWNAVRRATKAMYPDGIAVRANRMPLVELEPTPAFEKVVEASGGYGERVDDPAELPAALDRAVHAVKVERRQALLNVICRIA